MNGAGTVTLLDVASILYSDEFKLPIAVYYFCEFNENNYKLFLLHGVINLYVDALFLTGFDILVLGFILRAHQQLDLLASRIKELPDAINSYLKENPNKNILNVERKFLARIIRHHNMIFKFVITF